MNTYWLKAQILLALLCASSPVFGDDAQKISAVFNHNIPLESEPGQGISFPVLIQNSGTSCINGQASISSEDFELLCPNQSCTIKPGEIDLLLFGVRVPQGYPEGEFPIYLNIHANEDASIVHSSRCQLRVLPTKRLEAVVVHPPQYILAGNNFFVEVECTNSGNTPIHSSCQVEQTRHCSFEGDGLFTLAPNESIRLSLPFSTDRQCKEEYEEFLQFQIVDQTEPTVYLEETIPVALIPGGRREFDYFDKLPSYLQLFSSQQFDHTIGGVEMGGKQFDPIDDTGIEYLFRLPSYSRNTLYNQYQAFYFNYSAPLFNLTLGDTTYSLSPLTQEPLYGRGGELAFKHSIFQVGSFYSQSPFRTGLNFRTAACYLKYTPCVQTSIVGNYFNKTIENDPTSNIASIYAETAIKERIGLEMELAHDFRQGSNAGTDSLAFLANGSWNWKQDLWVNASKTYAGPSYFGYYNDLNATTGDIDLPIKHDLRFAGHISTLKQNLNPYESEICVCPDQKVYSADLRYYLSNGYQLLATGYYFRAKDEFEEPSFDFLQRWLRTSLSYTNQYFTLLCAGWVASEHNFLPDQRQRDTLQQYNLFLSTRNLRGFEWSISWDGGNIDYYNSAFFRNVFTTSINYQKQPSTRIGFTAFIGTNQPPSGCTNQQYTADIAFTNRKSHIFTFFGRWLRCRESATPHQFTFTGSYTVPLGIPLKRRKDLGTIGGVIRDRYSNQPVPNALVRINNERVLTDNAGYFSSALPPGSYTPKIELTPNQLIACSEEQKVHVRAGHHTSCNDHLVTDSGQIQGKVVLYEPSIEMESLERLFELDDFDFEYIEAELLAGMRVSISREQGREVYSTITNGNGSFLFNNLRPGQWSVVLIPNHQIPDGHKISQSEYLVNIQSGEKKELLFQVMPEIRSIKKMEPKKTSSNLCN